MSDNKPKYDFIKDPNDFNHALIGVFIMIFIFSILFCSFFMLCGCSINMQNINVDDVRAAPKFDSIFPSNDHALPKFKL